MTGTVITLGTKVQRVARFDGPEPVGEVVEIDEGRVRVLWPASPCAPARRSWLALRGYGKRWAKEGAK
jgi:hypothetical protein